MEDFELCWTLQMVVKEDTKENFEEGIVLEFYSLIFRALIHVFAAKFITFSPLILCMAILIFPAKE